MPGPGVQALAAPEARSYEPDPPPALHGQPLPEPLFPDRREHGRRRPGTVIRITSLLEAFRVLKPSRKDARGTARELIESFCDGGDLFSSAIDGIAEAELEASEAPAEWSVRQIVHHVADAEVIRAARLFRLLAEDAPAIEGIDELAYARRRARSGTCRSDQPREGALDRRTSGVT